MHCFKDQPVVLRLDIHVEGFTSRRLRLLLEQWCHSVSFPPHCSQKLQPLEKSVYGHLRKYVNCVCDSWMGDESTMAIYDIPGGI